MQQHDNLWLQVCAFMHFGSLLQLASTNRIMFTTVRYFIDQRQVSDENSKRLFGGKWVRELDTTFRVRGAKNRLLKLWTRPVITTAFFNSKLYTKRRWWLKSFMVVRWIQHNGCICYRCYDKGVALTFYNRRTRRVTKPTLRLVTITKLRDRKYVLLCTNCANTVRQRDPPTFCYDWAVLDNEINTFLEENPLVPIL